MDFRLVTTYTPTLFLCARAIGMLAAAEGALAGTHALGSYSPRPVLAVLACVGAVDAQLRWGSPVDASLWCLLAPAGAYASGRLLVATFLPSSDSVSLVACDNTAFVASVSVDAAWALLANLYLANHLMAWFGPRLRHAIASHVLLAAHVAGACREQHVLEICGRTLAFYVLGTLAFFHASVVPENTRKLLRVFAPHLALPVLFVHPLVLLPSLLVHVTLFARLLVPFGEPTADPDAAQLRVLRDTTPSTEDSAKPRARTSGHVECSSEIAEFRRAQAALANA